MIGFNIPQRQWHMAAVCHYTLPSEVALFCEVALGEWCDERRQGMMQTDNRWIHFLPFF